MHISHVNFKKHLQKNIQPQTRHYLVPTFTYAPRVCTQKVKTLQRFPPLCHPEGSKSEGQTNKKESLLYLAKKTIFSTFLILTKGYILN